MATLGRSLPRTAFSKQGFRGSDMMPIFEALVEIPELMVSGKGRVVRVINASIKDAMREEMEFHHKRRIPEHFNRFRQKKYMYMPRSERVQAIKRRRQQADLVKTRRTKQSMTGQMKITFPRSGVQGILCRGQMKWPAGFKFSSSASKGVTPEVMAKEITRWTLQEERVAGDHIARNHIRNLDQRLSVRAKKKLGPQLAKLGLSS